MLTNKPTRLEKHLYLFGVTDRKHLFKFNNATGQDELADEFKTKSNMKPSIMKARGLAAADKMLADAKKIHDARAKKEAG